MKVGIITFHRAHNYGAVLQAYALKKYLASVGCDAEIIDYWPTYRKGMYDLLDTRILSNSKSFADYLRFCKSCCMTVLNFRSKKKRIDLFDEFISSELNPVFLKDDLCGSDLIYDAIVYGSDQIWRFNAFPNYIGFDPVYWGDWPVLISGKKIAYSASMGNIDYACQSQDFMRNKYQNFTSVSVRENYLADFFRDELGVDVNCTLDPAFLISKSYYNSILSEDIERPKKYVLLYNLNSSKQAYQLATSISIKYGLELVVVTGSANTVKRYKYFYRDIGPRQFLCLFKNAEFVVSTSFHGVVFSLIYQKQFLATGMGMNASRVTDLLSALGLSTRYDEQFSTEIKSDIDYSIVGKELSFLKKASSDYLINALGICDE